MYDNTKLQSLRVNSSVILINYIFKNDGEPTIVITRKSKVLKTGTIEVPQQIREKGEKIANPPPATTRLLRDVNQLNPWYW